MRCSSSTLKKRGSYGMSGVGGAGGAGAGAAGAAGAGAVQAVTPVAGSPDSGDFSGGNGEVQAVGKDAGGSSNTGAHVHPMWGGQSMSTQNFIEIHNSSVQQVNESQSPEMDLKKLIEMMLAIKLLQEMNKM